MTLKSTSIQTVDSNSLGRNYINVVGSKDGVPLTSFPKQGTPENKWHKGDTLPALTGPFFAQNIPFIAETVRDAKCIYDAIPENVVWTSSNRLQSTFPALEPQRKFGQRQVPQSILLDADSGVQKFIVVNYWRGLSPLKQRQIVVHLREFYKRFTISNERVDKSKSILSLGFRDAVDIWLKRSPASSSKLQRQRIDRNSSLSFSDAEGEIQLIPPPKKARSNLSVVDKNTSIERLDDATLKIEGKTLDYHRQILGDSLKQSLQIIKKDRSIEPSTFCVTKVSLQVFKRLVPPNASSIVPENFETQTPVVVAQVANAAAMAAIFGASKIKSDTKDWSQTANKGELIYFPPTEELRVWWVLSLRQNRTY